MSTQYKLKVKDYNEDGQIVTLAEKTFYNTDDCLSASEWVRLPLKELNPSPAKYDAPQMTTAVNIKQAGVGRSLAGALGYMLNISNDRIKTAQGVALFSSCASIGHGLSVLPCNVKRVAALFAARLLVNNETTWVTAQDQFFAPDESHAQFDKFTTDSLVYSLFHSVSQQSALRDVDYKNVKYNIANQFFFMSVEEMKALAVEHSFNELYNDCIGKENSYIYNLLFGNTSLALSPDAKAVLTMARDLVKKSFPLRQAAHAVKPEMHLQAWDAGWYQIRNGILKDQFKEDYKAFTDLYKAFADRLRPMVYELGFLKK